MKSTYCAKIMLNYFYKAISKEYGVPKSKLKEYLQIIYPMLNLSKIYHLKNRVES